MSEEIPDGCPTCGALPCDWVNNVDEVREALDGVFHFADAVAYRDDPLAVGLRQWIAQLKHVTGGQ